MNIIVLFILFLIIIVFQIYYTFYLPMYYEANLQKIETKKEFNLKNKDKIENIFYEKLNKFGDQINYDEIDFTEWYENVKKEQFINIDNNEYYIFIYEKIANLDEYVNLLTYNKDESNIQFDDYIKINQESLLNTQFFISENIAENMFYLSTFGEIRNFNFYWIDPKYHYSVVKSSYFTKWKSTDGREGIIGVGMDTDILSYDSLYKYIKHIHKPELLFVIMIVFINSLILFSLNNNFSSIKSIVFLIATNIYILNYINTEETVSTVDFETNKIEEINKSILNISFLSSVSIFIIQLIYKKNRNLFIETGCVFSLSIICLLCACYKSTNQNNVFEIIGGRVTNQFLFNMSVFLNFIIILNFIFYTLFKKNY